MDAQSIYEMPSVSRCLFFVMPSIAAHKNQSHQMNNHFQLIDFHPQYFFGESLRNDNNTPFLLPNNIYSPIFLSKKRYRELIRRGFDFSDDRDTERQKIRQSIFFSLESINMWEISNRKWCHSVFQLANPNFESYKFFSIFFHNLGLFLGNWDYFCVLYKNRGKRKNSPRWISSWLNE